MNEFRDIKKNDSSQSKYLLNKPVETGNDMIDSHDLNLKKHMRIPLSVIDSYAESFGDEENQLSPEAQVLFFDVTNFIWNCRFCHVFEFWIYW